MKNLPKNFDLQIEFGLHHRIQHPRIREVTNFRQSGPVWRKITESGNRALSFLYVSKSLTFLV